MLRLQKLRRTLFIAANRCFSNSSHARASPPNAAVDFGQDKKFSMKYKGVPEYANIAAGKPCPGCGAKFQMEHEGKDGYINPRTLGKLIRKEDKRLRATYQLKAVNEMFETIRQRKSKPAEKSLFASIPQRASSKILDDGVGGKIEVVDWKPEAPDQATQSDAEETTFVSPEEQEVINKLQKRPVVPVCDRCKSIIYYSKQPDSSLSPEQFVEILEKLRTKNAIFVLVVDVFDMNSSFVPDMQRITGNNPVMIVATKYDLLPQEHITRAQIEEKVRHVAKSNFGLQHVKAVVAVSSQNRRYIGVLGDILEEQRKGRSVYFIGRCNVGKSSLINALMKKFMPRPGHEIPASEGTPGFGAEKMHATVFKAPGTTLSPIPFTLADGSHIYDTPGIMHQFDRDCGFELPAELRSPRRQISKPIMFNVKPGKAVLVSSLVQFNLLEGPPQGVKVLVFAAHKLGCTVASIRRANDGLAVRNSGGLDEHVMLRPRIESRDVLSDTYRFEIELFNPKISTVDISVSHIGWISLCGSGDVVFEVHTPQGFVVRRRNALVEYPVKRLTAVTAETLYAVRHLHPHNNKPDTLPKRKR
uniref:G domain-containing protein n=1 Tax=Eutreptiella gymnastica TaxID=73025 RepID=A0A6T2C8F9_9EUGL